MSHFYWLVSKCGSYQQTHCAMIMLYRRLSLVTRPWQRPSLNLSHCTTQDHWLGATITEIATTVSQCQSFIWDSRKLRSVFRALVNWPSFCLPLITLVHLCLVNLVISPSFACVLKFYLFSLSLLGLIKVTCVSSLPLCGLLISGFIEYCLSSSSLSSCVFINTVLWQLYSF